MSIEAYDAIVLAGGRSSRMGGIDKLGAVVDGRTLLARACAAVEGAGRLVVVGPAGLDVPSGAVTVQEDPPYSGPAAAMGAGLARLGDEAAELVVVLAADVPRGAEAVRLLREALIRHPDDDGVVACSAEGRRQPLVAVHRTRPFRRALAAHEPLAGLSARRVTSGLELAEIVLADEILDDVDTPADLRRLNEETDDG